MSHSVKIARTMALSMLLIVSTYCAAQVHDFCSFAGVWNSQGGKKALTIHISDNQPQCILSGKTTSDIAIANNKIYIDFNEGQKTNGCVTIDTVCIYIGSIEEDINTLRLTSRRFVKIHSKWWNEFMPIEKEDTTIFHKKSNLPCGSKMIPKGGGIEDTTCEAFKCYANIYLIENGFNTWDSVDNWFSYFAYLSDVINKYESRNSMDSLRDIDCINLQWALSLRSDWFMTCMRDTLSGINDLERVLEGSQNTQLDSAFRIRLSNLYGELASSSEPNTIKVSPTGKALEYYQKSKEHFEKARVRDITALGISDIQPLYAYWRLDKDTVKLNVRDSIIADFFYKNPDWISPLNADYASLTTAVLLNRRSYDSLFTFYDTIRNRFVFDESILANYLTGLIRDGYSSEDVKKVGERLSATGKDGKAHSARINMLIGDFDSMFYDLLNNEKDLDSILDMDGESFSHNIIAMMAGKRLGYRSAYERCDSLINGSLANPGIDSSLMLCYRGIYKLKCAKEEIKDIKYQARLISSAEEDLRKVIAYESTHEELVNIPYAYYWLNLKDSTIYWTEKLLQGNDTFNTYDTLFAYLTAADIYCLLGDYRLAKYYIDCFIQNTDIVFEKEVRPFIRALLKYDEDNLKPISKYVDSICARYDSVEASQRKMITFDTTKTTLYCHLNEGGVYVRCKIGQATDTSLLFDPGARYLQITKKFACELMEKDPDAIKYHLNYEELETSNACKSKQEIVILSSIKLGELPPLNNVVATIAEDPYAPMLLGMSALSAYDIELSLRKSTIKLKYIKELLEK